MKSVVIIGSGIAGLYCALRCADHSNVRLITKDQLAASSSNYAQGGIAAVLDKQDSFAKHVRDTIRAGSRHNTTAAVELIIQQAPSHIQRLLNLGVAFNLNPRGSLDLTREGGHSQRRIVHVHDMTGQAVEQALIKAVRQHPNITIQEWEFTIDLLTHRRRVRGVRTAKGNYDATAVLLATGGAGQIYPYTTNPNVVTGDGIAMALRAGAAVRDMEFVQFHPTAYYIPGRRPFLLSEALRGEGARLVNYQQKRFINELRPRDVVSRAVYRQQRQGLVYLDFRHQSKAFLQKRFPSIYQTLQQDHLRLEQDLIPITPVAHYLCGGIHTNLFGQTSLAGLYAIGETAHTGLHGANRLASNSLLECLVLASRSAEAIGRLPAARWPAVVKHTSAITWPNDDTLIGLRQQLQNIMWEAGGIVRTRAGLTSGLSAMRAIRQTVAKTPYLELQNMAMVGEAVLAAALKRRHSLGCHYRVN